jgi:hypothetical protein
MEDESLAPLRRKAIENCVSIDDRSYNINKLYKPYETISSTHQHYSFTYHKDRRCEVKLLF